MEDKALQTIFVVEDDENIREMVLYALRTAGFAAEGFADGGEALSVLAQSTPCLLLLDIMLPGTDGVTILKQLRQNERYRQLPVIMLTAKGSELDRVKGLDSGADDYITKPFSIMELISRVKAVLRRCSPENNGDEELRLGPITLHQAQRTVKVQGEEIALTYKEFELLQYLLINHHIVLSRDKLLEQVWGFDYGGESRTVDMHIKSLRQKLGEAGAGIKTVRNVGYKMEG